VVQKVCSSAEFSVTVTLTHALPPQVRQSSFGSVRCLVVTMTMVLDETKPRWNPRRAETPLAPMAKCTKTAALVIGGAAALLAIAGCGSASTKTVTGVVVTDDPSTEDGSSGCFIPNWPGPGEYSPNISTLQVVVHAPSGTVLGTASLHQPTIKPLPGSLTGYQQCFYAFQISGLPAEPRYGIEISPSGLGTIWVSKSEMRNVIFNKEN
jgi:hypothetical protein